MAIGIGDPHHHRRAVRHAPEACLALGERLLRPPRVGYVAHDEDPALDGAAANDRRVRTCHRDRAAVLVEEGVLVGIEARAAEEDMAQWAILHRIWPAVRVPVVDEFVKLLPVELRLAPPEHPFGGRVGVDRCALFVEKKDGVGRMLHHQLRDGKLLLQFAHTIRHARFRRAAHILLHPRCPCCRQHTEIP
jgi:hypothetical protein